jgi:glycosyltransferase involved in cell wall biosynthesis
LPDFSIVIPVFNRVAPLGRAVESVLAQSYDNFEIIIVDDGSCADSAKEIQSLTLQFADERIRLLRHEYNKNGAAARNTGIKAAQGSFLCFLDSDDFWLPDKLERVKACIQDACVGESFLIHHQYCNSKNGALGLALPKNAKASDESVAHYSFVTNNVGGIQSSTICVPTQLAKVCLFNEAFIGHQDWDFALKCGAKTLDFRFIQSPLTVRGKDSKDSVADGLNWKYSLWFYSQMSQYFDSDSAFYYFNRVVLRKAKNSVQIFPLIFNRLFFRILCLRPGSTINAVYVFFKSIARQKKRIGAVALLCKKRGAKRIMIWGANDYAKLLILHLGEGIAITQIIDSKISFESNQLLGINIVPILTITKDELDNIDGLILATDKHQQSMKKELSDIYPALLDKVIEF